MDPTRTEQVKLTATYLNGIGIAFFAVGVLAPMFSTLYGSSMAGPLNLAIGAGVCFFASIVLHLMARRSLKVLST